MVTRNSFSIHYLQKQLTMKHISLFFFLFCLTATIRAQNPVVQVADDTTKPIEISAPKDKVAIRVSAIKKYRPDVDSHTNKDVAVLYPEDYVMVKINRHDLDSAKKNMQQYRLWIDGICFPNMHPLFISNSESAVIFQIARDTLSSSPWQLLYSSPTYWRFHRDVAMNLGTLTTEFTQGKDKFIVDLHTTTKEIPWIFYPLFLLLLLTIIRYGKPLLKDTALYSINGVKINYKAANPADHDNGILNISEIPYSLARYQFLVWLIVIFFAILHIWVITDVMTSPVGSTLILLGISSGTYYIGKIIDKQQTPTTVLTPAEQVKLFISNNQLSQGLMHDILSDGNSISLHRLQLVIFTAFLSLYFLSEVLGCLIMPQFDATMLSLMGISSTMYAGVKTTE